MTIADDPNPTQWAPGVYTMNVGDFLAQAPLRDVALVHADPPWNYRRQGVQGAAQNHYTGLSEIEIAHHLAAAHALVRRDAYMVVWCTFPKLERWIAQGGPILEAAGWIYITGGPWLKTDRGTGVGVHLRGKAEWYAVYKTGHPRPRNNVTANGILAPRGSHSEKPQVALRRFLDLFTDPGDPVLDLYAGESGSMVRAGRYAPTGPRPVWAVEADLVRAARARRRASQDEIPGMIPDSLQIGPNVVRRLGSGFWQDVTEPHGV